LQKDVELQRKRVSAETSWTFVAHCRSIYRGGRRGENRKKMEKKRTGRRQRPEQLDQKCLPKAERIPASRGKHEVPAGNAENGNWKI